METELTNKNIEKANSLKNSLKRGYTQTETNLRSINPGQDFHQYSDRNSKPPILNQTYNDIFLKEIDWGNQIKKYGEEKQVLKWGKNPNAQIIGSFYVRTVDRSFNPITQKYRDQSYDKKLKESEKKELVQKISTFYDTELSNTQTYNIISLQDKFKGFESDINYPHKREKNLYTAERNPSLQNFNIISNIGLKEHHYDKPENRINLPKGDKDIYVCKAHSRMINIRDFKDYDIISNEYNNFDKEKQKADLEINKLNAAKSFFKERDYDIIRGVYYDQNKEKNYQREKSLNDQKLRQGKRDTLFNAFNNVIYDEENLKIKDMLNQNAKLRYSLKSQIEKYYHQIDLNKFSSDENILKNKLGYDRFKFADKRGYDLVNFKPRVNNYKNTIECTHKNTPWEILKLGVDKKNETITKKDIYKSPYDKTDVDAKSFEFNQKREKVLKNLVPIKNEEEFKIKEFQHKARQKTIPNESRKTYKNIPKNVFKTDKDLWFSKQKNVNMKDN